MASRSDGHNVWFASGDKLNALDPESGKTVRTIDVAAHAGTAFDGQHLFQLSENRIQKIDPKSGRVLATIPAPGDGGDSGLAWAEGSLWVGQYREKQDPPDRSRDRSDPAHHRIQSLRHRRHLGRRRAWHGTWEGDESELRRIDPQTGEVLESSRCRRSGVSGLESDGGDRFFCGGGPSGKVRAVSAGRGEAPRPSRRSEHGRPKANLAAGGGSRRGS